MSIYGIMSTEKAAGFIEVVHNATTAAKIQKVTPPSFPHLNDLNYCRQIGCSGNGRSASKDSFKGMVAETQCNK